VEKSELQKAVSYLASVCDGAKDLDGAGFNSIDTRFGKKLNSMSSWTPRQARAAWRMIGKYRGQLSGAGIDYTQIPEPPKVDKTIPIAPRNVIVVDGSKGKALFIQFPYDSGVVDGVRAMKPLGAWFQKNPTGWNLPAKAAVVEPLYKFMVDYDFEFSDLVVELLESVIQTHTQAVESSKSNESTLEVLGLGGELRPFQRAGGAYAGKAKRCFIADEMGLGKTVEALATLQAEQAFPALVVCPASLKLNWKREAEKWLPGKTVKVLNGKNGNGDYEADVLVINYDVLSKHTEVLKARGLKAVVLDESHYCKNYKAKRTEAAKAVVAGVHIRLCLTGTPLPNRPQELLSQLEILGRLEDLGGFWPFAKRHCGAHRTKYGWDLSGAEHLDELNEKLRAFCYVRRNKAEVLSELPAKQRSILPVEIDNRREYDRAEADLIGWLKDRAAADKAFLTEIKDLPEEEQKARKEARAEEAGQKARNAEQLVRIEALKQLAARGKLEAVQEWVESFLETDQKLVLFAWHKEIVQTLAERFSAPSITGETPVEQRQAAVDRFQTDPSCRLIVCNVQAGGVGITLTAASNVAFVELGWNPATHDQAEDRCHRIGQTDQVTAWYLLAENTIDQQIQTLIEEKRSVVNAATEGTGEARDAGILSELVKRLAV